MCRIALICILIQEVYVKKFFSKRAVLHILNVYSHTKLNTPVLVWSLQLSNFGLNHIIVHFSVTIDCVRFLMRRFTLYTYSMAHTHSALVMNLAIIFKQVFASINTRYQSNHPLPIGLKSIVDTNPPKWLDGLSWNLQGIFLKVFSCASDKKF